jgi:hypothetical protein
MCRRPILIGTWFPKSCGDVKELKYVKSAVIRTAKVEIVVKKRAKMSILALLLIF